VEREHQLTVVLADETRYRIYRSIAEKPHVAVTVADVARRFGLHPNVARMHLGKLARAGLLVTGLRKTNGGGRPARLYRLSDTVSSFAVPPRRYELLSVLALTALAQKGSDAEVLEVCREAGRSEGRRFLAKDGLTAGGSKEAVAENVRRSAEEQGLLPEVGWRNGRLELELHNCPFREVSSARPDLVCPMHRAYFEGLVGAIAGELRDGAIVDGESMSRGAETCRLHFDVGKI